MQFDINFLLLSFLTVPSLLLAEEPSGGTLIMISIGAWALAAAAIIGVRRYRRARQQQCN